MLHSWIEEYRPLSPQEAADQQRMLFFVKTQKQLLFRSNTAMHFTASAWVVDPSRQYVLMVYHLLYRSWSWCGGHADGTENLLHVAQREVQEETGITGLVPLLQRPISLEILRVQQHFKDNIAVAPHLHLNLTFAFIANPMLPLRPKHDENSAVRWFPSKRVVHICAEAQMRPIYQKLNARLFPPL
ncbi:MAG: NUDIX hydrolase [Eubacteriales bacterium]|nr:NUDIX hydrolase [Eubacteriales bacterium]